MTAPRFALTDAASTLGPRQLGRAVLTWLLLRCIGLDATGMHTEGGVVLSIA